MYFYKDAVYSVRSHKNSLLFKAFVHFLIGLHLISFAKSTMFLNIVIIINMLFDLCSMLKIKEFTSQTKL